MAKKKELSIEEKLKEALIQKEEQPYELPAGWEWVKLGSISTFIDYRGKTPEKVDKGIPLITAKNIKMGYISEEPKEYIRVEDYEKWMTRGIPEKGDVVITTEAPLGNIAQLNFDNKFALAQRAITLSNLNVNKRYLFYSLLAPFFQDELKKNGTGSTVQGIKSSILKTLEIPLPPIKEQNRIAEKLDSMLGKVKEAKDLIAEARETFETRRASILNKAFRGELTEKWRNENPSEDAMELLEKINEEKLKRWEEECSEAEKAGKKKPAKPKLLSPEEMLVPEEEHPYELPDGWKWIKFGKLFNVFSGKNLTRKELLDDGSIPVYGGNGIMGYYNQNNFGISKLILGRVGFYCGCVHITETKSWITDNSLIVDFDENNLEILFLYHLFIHLKLGKTSNSTAQPVISGKSLENVETPLPPLAEQQEIVKIVEELLKAEEEASDLLGMEDSIELLEKSILDKAFRGELRTSDANDEPAIEMLKRIL